MQHGTSQAEIHESVLPSIPPDIYNCLLIIAQFGPKPEELMRWYSSMRNHLTNSGLGSPLTTPSKDNMPPPQTPMRSVNSAGQFRPTSSSSSLISPPAYHLPTFHEGIIAHPVTPIQDIPLIPWPTPDPGHRGDASLGSWTTPQFPTLPEDYSFGSGFEPAMNIFTGYGLLPAPVNEVPRPGPPRTPNVPVQLGFNSVPVLIRKTDGSAQKAKGELRRQPTLPPPRSTLPSQSPSTTNPSKKRKITRPRSTTMSQQTPRRSSVHVRHSEQFPPHPPIAPKMDGLSQQPLLDDTPVIDRLPYNTTPHLPPRRYSAAFPSPQPPRSTDGSGYGPFGSGQQQVGEYRSPYV